MKFRSIFELSFIWKFDQKFEKIEGGIVNVENSEKVEGQNQNCGDHCNVYGPFVLVQKFLDFS